MRKKVVYCSYCGKKNYDTDINCKHCERKLDSKDHLFREFLYDHIKDELKDRTTDKFFSLIKNFIISHLYGTVFVSLVVFMGAATIVNAFDKDYELIEDAPKIIDVCKIKDAVIPTKVCENGYSLSDEKCVRTVSNVALENTKCPNGYTLSNNQCVSNQTFATNTVMECLLPTEYKERNNPGIYYLTKIDSYSGKCMLWTCTGTIPDDECAIGGSWPIDFTPVEYCPNGTTKINGQCKKTANPGKEYYCDKGTLKNNICETVEEKDYNLSCEAGYVLNTECNLCEKE